MPLPDCSLGLSFRTCYNVWPALYGPAMILKNTSYWTGGSHLSAKENVEQFTECLFCAFISTINKAHLTYMCMDIQWIDISHPKPWNDMHCFLMSILDFMENALNTPDFHTRRNHDKMLVWYVSTIYKYLWNNMDYGITQLSRSYALDWVTEESYNILA